MGMKKIKSKQSKAGKVCAIATDKSACTNQNPTTQNKDKTIWTCSFL
jgi:hypothetical protein